jgi:AsmA family
MADATVTSPAPRKRHGWLRIRAWMVGIFIVLLVIVYFVATSSGFFKSVILPKVSTALGANVTVSSASISPFKQVVLRDLKVQTTGTEPLVSAPEVRLRYSLGAIIGGNIKVSEVALISPAVTLVENPDGTSNLDPIMKKLQEKPAQPKPPSKPSKPTQIDIQKVTLSNGTISRAKLYPGGKKDLDQLSNVNVEVTNLKNGGTGKLTLGSDIKVENNPPPPQTSGLLQAKLNGSFDLGLSPDLKPTLVQGDTRFEVSRAEGSLAQAAALGATLNCNVTPTDIKELALRFQKGNTRRSIWRKPRANWPFNC